MPPQPVTRRAVATPTKVTNRPTLGNTLAKIQTGSTNLPSSSEGLISADSVTQLIKPSIRPKTERILLLGDTVSGKTYAWLRKARAVFEQAIAEGIDPPRFWAMDTQNSLSAFLNEGDEFDYLYYENGGNIYPFECVNFLQTRASFAYIKKNARPGDWIVLDLINHFYQQCQEFIAGVQNKNLDDETLRRMISNRGFGAFDPDEWQMVRRAFEGILNTANYNMGCNFVGVQHITQIVDVAGRNRKELLSVFDEVGYKPDGAPRVPGIVDTILMLWTERQIPRGDSGKRSGEAKTVRWFLTLKDRGRSTMVKKIYDRDAFDTLDAVRATKVLQDRSAVNVLDPKEAEELHDDVIEGEFTEESTADTTVTTAGTIMDTEDIEISEGSSDQ